MHSCMVDVTDKDIFPKEIKKKVKQTEAGDDTLSNTTPKIYKNIGIYEEEELVCGAMGYFIYGWYILEYIWVKPDHRHLGYGKWMIAQLEQMAKQKKVNGIRLKICDSSFSTYYQKLGYDILEEKEIPHLIQKTYCLEKRFHLHS